MSSSDTDSMRARTLAATTLLLTVAAAYETFVALRVLPMGKEPGQGPYGAGLVMLIALLALLVATITSYSYVSGLVAEWRAVVSLVAPAAAVFVVARFYAFDPYYLPTLRRMSDGGLVTGWWIVAVVAVALLAGFFARVRPRIGALMTSIALLLSAVTAIGEGVGH